jgi:G patch domain/KOW motif-containing protein
VVTKKLSSRQYKQKGLVLDVTHGGACATLQMSDGQLLDHVPERYLETALPKVGGSAIVLTGEHRLSKGRLLERSSDCGTGVIQVFDDMNVLKLSLDDIAEWCGLLDDDLEL